MSKCETVVLTNMCMVYDDNGNILVQNRTKNTWPGITFPGGHVEKDDRSPQHRSTADDLRVNDVADADDGKDQHLLEDAFEAHGRGQLLVDNGAHDAGDVVDHHKRKQCVKQAVTTSQEPSEPTADGSEGDLNGCPKFLHRDFLL